MILKKIIYIFFANLININIYLIKKFNKNNFTYIHSNKISFGDTFIFYIENYEKIIKNNLKIIVFSKLEKRIADFFFSKKNIKNLLFLIPYFVPVYTINSLLRKKKNFISDISCEVNHNKRRIKNIHKILLLKLLKRNINLVSPKLKKIKNKKFVLMFIKHYNKSKLITDGTNSRHTLNFNKIYKIIDFFIKKKKINLKKKN